MFLSIAHLCGTMPQLCHAQNGAGISSCTKYFFKHQCLAAGVDTSEQATSNRRSLPSWTLHLIREAVQLKVYWEVASAKERN